MKSTQKTDYANPTKKNVSLSPDHELESSLINIQLKSYLDVVDVIIVAINRNQDVTFINKKGCEILGYSDDEIVGKNWFDHFLPQKNSEEVKSVFNQIITGKFNSVEYYENPVLTKNGQERIILWHNTVLLDEKSRIIGALGSGEDATEQKQAEQIHLENKERLEKIIENTSAGYFFMDKEGIIKEVNDAWVKLYKYDSISTILWMRWIVWEHFGR